VNHSIIYNLQDIFNLLPNLTAPDTIKSFAVKTNDELLIIYLSSLIRAVIALHNLIANKITNRDEEKMLDDVKAAPAAEAVDGKDKDGKEVKEGEKPAATDAKGKAPEKK
jgi:26S proteasome regulatory subunit N8